MANPLLQIATSYGFGAINSGLEGLFGSDGAEVTREFNAKQAHMNRAFQERMSSTAYQRSMLDMKKAGLNPILAYSKGGASTPGGSMASGSNPVPTGDTLSKLATNALGAVRLRQEIKNMREVQSRDREQAQLNRDQGNLANENERLLKLKGIEQNQTNALQAWQMYGAKSEGDLDKTPYGQFFRKWNRGVQGLLGNLPIKGR